MMTKFTCCLALTASLALAAKSDYHDGSGVQLQDLLHDDHGLSNGYDEPQAQASSGHDNSYADNSDPHWKNFEQLDVSGYNNKELNAHQNAWVVAFVSPTCSSCNDLADKWESIQQHGLDHNVKYAYVNTATDEGKEILRNYTGDVNVQYTPTILVYGSDKSRPEEYYGDYESQDEINNYVCDYCDTNGYGHGEPAGKEHVAADTYDSHGFDHGVLDQGFNTIQSGFDDFSLGAKADEHATFNDLAVPDISKGY